ncbi:hypothetical protein BN59_00764 [Legionella massiliensis]|uniref:Ankyrin repeats (3 copies) n=1 Tax=Legionella massiliensis TaxID=1034943 RepID=A0A078KQ50_9GAMM|nr:hypothetical protein [Legionella massiliensis]CDZ76495.1 hypothetical protein BN59_00764 [Legionella massiliensis]CEE12233.1 hypothetical protein BN1094_00764 [Legionella massiliensis]
MREKLEAAIHEIKTPYIRKKLQRLTNKKQYQDALLYACEQCVFDCDYEKDPLFQFIKLLIEQRQTLALDVNQSAANHYQRPVIYALRNNHIIVLKLLEQAGAKFTSQELIELTALELDNNLLEKEQRLAQIFESLHNDEFANEEATLHSRYSRLTNQSQAVMSDNDRLIFIIKTINHLSKYFSKVAVPLQTPLPNEMFEKAHKDYSVNLASRHITRLCSAIKGLSPTLQEKYNDCFQPIPFTWITLEQFAYFAKPRAIIGAIIGFPCPRSISKQGSQLYSSKLYREILDSRVVIEHATKDIINSDLLSLKNFFSQIFAVEILNQPSNVSKVSLLAMKTLTTRMMDNEILLKLLSLLDYSQPTFQTDLSDSPATRKTVSSLVFFRTPEPGEGYKDMLNLSTRTGRFAALRRLQLIGELITGKNLSSSLLCLDNSVNWRAFIEIRDAIVHQDEGDNKHKIETLLMDNTGLLEQIMDTDLPELLKRIYQLLSLREQTLSYDGNPNNHWSRLRDFAVSNEEARKQSKPVKEVERRVSEDEEERVIRNLQTKNAPQEVITQFRVILDGTGPIPETKTMGTLKRYLPQRGENRDEFAALSTIINKAVSKGKMPEKERLKLRQEAQKQAAERKLAEQNHYVGFENIRHLAHLLHEAPIKENCMTAKKRVLAAKEALANARECLLEKGYIVAGQPFKTLEEWDQFHVTQGGPCLTELLINDQELFYALGYCTAQALQHLEKIHAKMDQSKLDFPTQYLGPKYDYLRKTRNLTEHCALYLDNLYRLDELPEGDFNHYFQKWFAPRVIDIIFHLDEDLDLVNQILFDVPTLSTTTTTTKVPLVIPEMFRVAIRTTPEDGNGKDKDKSYDPDCDSSHFSI